ncbi:MAG: DNA-directed RNA polymerase subunit D [Candidatus Methanofastidiosia archaeon]
MEFEYINKGEKDVMEFIVEGTTTALVNALRRVVMSEIPTYACKEVVFYENSSPLFDEIIAHRIGLIPLKTPFGTEEGDRMVTLSLECKGPAIVYSENFVSDDTEVVPIDGGFPIITLGNGQKVSLNAECMVGYGKDHVRWQAGIASYKNYPIIRIDEKKCDLCGICVKMCPLNILKINDDALEVVDGEKCIFCKVCEETCRESFGESIITITPQKDKFIFRIESFKNMSAKELLLTALNVIEKKSKSFEEKIKS